MASPPFYPLLLNGAKRSRTMVEAFGLPVLGGSDTYQSIQHGCIVNKFEEDCQTIDELKINIAEVFYYY